MPQYRRKGSIVPAVRFDPHGEHRTYLPEMVIGIGPRVDEVSTHTHDWAHDDCRFYLQSMNGQQELRPGDWILPEVELGLYYPVKDEVFRKLYEQLPDDEPYDPLLEDVALPIIPGEVDELLGALVDELQNFPYNLNSSIRLGLDLDNGTEFVLKFSVLPTTPKE